MLWIGNVTELRLPLTAQSPIAVRHVTLESEAMKPTPECHPYCEFSILIEGEIIQFIRNQQIRRVSGDVFLAGPGLPHCSNAARYPWSYIAIHFLPSFLIEMGPLGDGLRLLRRFFAAADIHSCVAHPPPSAMGTLGEGFAAVAREYGDLRPGREFRLRSVFAMLLAEFDRWEQSQCASSVSPVSEKVQWKLLQQALRYLQEHYSEPIYSSQLADHLGIGETRLKTLFRQTLGAPWGRYLKTYRVQQAVMLLAAGELNVTEVAAEVGFDTLSNFENTFRSVTGMTPKMFTRNRRAADNQPGPAPVQADREK